MFALVLLFLGFNFYVQFILLLLFVGFNFYVQFIPF